MVSELRGPRVATHWAELRTQVDSPDPQARNSPARHAEHATDPLGSTVVDAQWPLLRGMSRHRGTCREPPVRTDTLPTDSRSGDALGMLGEVGIMQGSATP